MIIHEEFYVDDDEESCVSNNLIVNAWQPLPKSYKGVKFLSRSRKILYKAKRIDNGEWVEGFYFEFEYKSYIICLEETIIHAIYTEESGIVDFDMRAFEVEPETVCQYAGLNDKNGKKIWENDIVSRYIFENKVIGTITWTDIGFTGFCLKVQCSDGTSYFPVGRGTYDDDESKQCTDEVIGNIFDNPNP